MRKRHGTPWSGLENAILIIEFRHGHSLERLADAHERTKCSIATQLVRLNLLCQAPGKPHYFIVGEIYCSNEDTKE